MRAPRTFSLNEISRLVGGEVVGTDIEVTGLATLRNARPGELSFLTKSIYREDLAATQASAVILSVHDRELTDLPRVTCGDPYLAYAKVAQAMAPPENSSLGVHATAIVQAGAKIGPRTSIGAYCVVGAHCTIGAGVSLEPGCSIGESVSIGEDSTIRANVAIYRGCRLGARNLVHAGAVIGADGFGMAREAQGWRKIPQLGGVWIGNDVEVGANTTVDRGALDDTVIEDGVKLDNQIQIGHNVFIGAHSAFAGCVGVAGSSRIGRRCTVGGGTVVLGHLEICDDVHIAAASVVTKSIIKSGTYAGLYPLQERAAWARNAVLLRNLDAHVRRIRGAAQPSRGRENLAEDGGKGPRRSGK